MLKSENWRDVSEFNLCVVIVLRADGDVGGKVYATVELRGRCWCHFKNIGVDNFMQERSYKQNNKCDNYENDKI